MNSCATCKYGYDVSVHAGAVIHCAPQNRRHRPDYQCSGFIRMTHVDFEERTNARFGKPTPTLTIVPSDVETIAN